MKRSLAMIVLVLLLFSGCAAAHKSAVDTGSTDQSTQTKAASSEVVLEKADLSKIFTKHSLTMVNVWATFCQPCIGELPELGELSADYKKSKADFQIVGIVIDAIDEDGNVSADQVSLAKEIITETKADYLHILPSDDLLKGMLADVSAVPTTFFFDKNGKQVGEAIMGAQSKADWTKTIDERLAQVSGGGNE
jgi:thiol-disulfide isomerase/thioredoxin